MKKAKLIFILLLGVHSFLWSNPIDTTPVTKFSELVFDKNNDWTMELLLSNRYNTDFVVDSVIIKVSGVEARLLISLQNENGIYVITSDSLSFPIVINRDGDSIEIVTYLTRSPYHGTRNDYLIFGNYPEAGVESPKLEFSTISRIFGNIDCLSNNSSIGAINNTVGLSATMNGRIYDVKNNLVTQIKFPYYFKLETPLTINSDGTYTTLIFRRFPTEIKNYLDALVQNHESLSDTTPIQPFELNGIHPDSVVIQDIHLKSNKFVVTSVEENEPLHSEELTLINYPNPFNLSTNFFVKIPDRMKDKAGAINIYNTNGQLVKAIPVNESTTVNWDGRDKNGNIMPSGIYYYQFNIEKQMMKSGSMILLK